LYRSLYLCRWRGGRARRQRRHRGGRWLQAGRRNSLARAVFHGQRGQLRRHYQVGQENQLDSLGIMINVIVLWQTVYIQAALDHLAAKGYPIAPADAARLTPLGHPTINLDGRYRTTNRPPATGLRPLRIN
jgi:TnpA family transposase